MMQVEIPIHVKDGKSDVIKISGQGIENCTQELAKRDPKLYTDTIPIRQVFDILNEDATLSLVFLFLWWH